jgi:murein DD-endopeptidase MepM/ murein hydrolase activator NlpD
MIALMLFNRLFFAILFIAAPLCAGAVDFPGGSGTAAPAAAFPGAAPADNSGGFLSASSFPKTAADLSFTQRMQLLKDGYEPFETEYDADGHCVSGCAYSGMNLQSEVKFYEQKTAEALARAAQLQALNPNYAPAPAVAGTKTESYTQASGTPALTISGAAASCPVPTPQKNSLNPAQTVPLGYPLDSPVHINSPYGPRTPPKTQNGRTGTKYHYGTDLQAATGTPVFSTLSGTVVFAGDKGDCGNFVKVRGNDGFSAGFCHLSQISVKNGDRVNAGCVLGKSGNTGNSGGPHLHYIVYDKDNAQINPAEFIKR